MRHRIASIVGLLAAGAAAAGDGLVPPDGQAVWPQWQARITVSTSTLAPVSLTGLSYGAQRSFPQLGALVGDYYFDTLGLRLPSLLGGLRATGGLMAGSRGLALGLATPLRVSGRLGLGWPGGLSVAVSEPPPDALPYLGLGYTGWSIKGGWGITADLGLVAEGVGGSLRTAPLVFGVQGMDNAVRDLRLSPVLQVGVSYAF